MQIHLMQSLLFTHLHHFRLKVFQISFCQMMLVAGATVDLPFHVRFFLHIQFPHTVENDVYVDIAAFIMTVCVRTDQNLMPWKMLLCELHSELMSQFCGQLSIGIILRIEADDIVVRFYIREFLVFGAVYHSAV